MRDETEVVCVFFFSERTSVRVAYRSPALAAEGILEHARQGWTCQSVETRARKTYL